MKPFNVVAPLSLALVVAGCARVPTSICAMPAVRELWQGVTIDWVGEIVDIMSVPHGGVRAFTDRRCGYLVQIDPRAATSFYSGTESAWHHAAVARYRVAGRLVYFQGQVVLSPTVVRRLSPWSTGAAFDTYYREREQAYRRD